MVEMDLHNLLKFIIKWPPNFSVRIIPSKLQDIFSWIPKFLWESHDKAHLINMFQGNKSSWHILQMVPKTLVVKWDTSTLDSQWNILILRCNSNLNNNHISHDILIEVEDVEVAAVEIAPINQVVGDLFAMMEG